MPKIGVNKIRSFTGHRDAVYALSPGRIRDNFLSGAGDGMIVSWNLNGGDDGQLIARVPNSIYSLHLIPDSDYVIAGHNYDGVHIIDVPGRKETASLKITDSAIFDIKSYGPDLLAACGDGSVYQIPLNPLRIKKQIKNSAKSARAMAINRDINQLAVAYSDNFIRIFDLGSFSLVREINAHKNSVFTLCFSPDGKWLLSGGRDARMNIWNVNSAYSLENSIVAHLYAINHICYSPDGKYFATCSMDKTIKIWQAEEPRLLKVIDKARHAGHISSVNRLYWSEYNNWLISGSDDRTINIWEINFNEQ